MRIFAPESSSNSSVHWQFQKRSDGSRSGSGFGDPFLQHVVVDP
jgi:hypothetical protein